LDEAFAIALHHERNLEVKIIRFFNTVGPRQSAAYGMVIPKFFKAALSNQPLVIYGDGSQRRIFCHVSDAISGILALWGKSEANGDVYNLGGIEETTIIHLANKILEITKSKSEVQFLPYSELKKRGFEDIQRRLPDISKIENLTSWKPLKGLDEILHDYHRFLMN
jgi:UDP-glucose 4-epimerase